MPRLITLALLGLTTPAMAAELVSEPVDGGGATVEHTSEAGHWARRGDRSRSNNARSGRSSGDRAGSRSSSGRSRGGDRDATEATAQRPRDGQARPPAPNRDTAGLGLPDSGSDRTPTRGDRDPSGAERPNSRPDSTGRPDSRPRGDGTRGDRPTRGDTSARPPTSSRPPARPYTGNRPPARPPSSARPPARPPIRNRAAPPRQATPPAARRAPRYSAAYRPPPRYRWYHGVFVYGPRPVHHARYAGQVNAAPRQADMPTRAVDRTGSFAVGLRAGSYISDSSLGPVYGDTNLGLSVRYRPVESFGLEVAVSHADESWSADSLRAQTLFQGSAMLFAAPWSRVSPYVLGGVTYNDRGTMAEYAVDQEISDGQVQDLFGLHAGAGLEIAIGPSVALDLEGRYVHYLNTAGDPAGPGAIQGNVGLLFHF